ncbi:MAG: hypothetical protein ABI197_14800, partial [Granulicella sp.]
MRPVRVGGPVGQNPADSPAENLLARSVMANMNSGARATSVNRTHRVIRERALAMREDRSRMRGMLLPLLVCSALLILFYSASWLLLDQYEVITGVPLDGHRWFLLLLWFLPASVALVAMIWF